MVGDPLFEEHCAKILGEKIGPNRGVKPIALDTLKYGWWVVCKFKNCNIIYYPNRMYAFIEDWILFIFSGYILKKKIQFGASGPNPTRN